MKTSSRCGRCRQVKEVVVCDACGKRLGAPGTARTNAFFLGTWETVGSVRRRKGGARLRPYCNNDPLVACSIECLIKVMEDAARSLSTRGRDWGIGLNLRTTNAPEVLKSFARQLRSIRA